MNYRALTLPKLSWNSKISTETSGELIVQPLEPGFGITLGNALRRVILASVEGSAITSVIIKGANNEFSTLKGVVEDILYILLNVKELVIKNSTGLPGNLYLKAEGEGPVTAAAIKPDEHLEILNKDHVVANLAVNGELEIEFFVETGRGYKPANWDKNKPIQEDGRIFIDAMFSPILRVDFNIEKTRVGQEIGYDKLLFRVHTNGVVSPQDAVFYGTSVLRTQLEHFLATNEIPFNEISQKVEEEAASRENTIDVDGATKGLPVELFLRSINELEFSVRAHNCLISSGIKRVIDLVNLTEDDLLKIKNFGRKSLREVNEILGAFGLSLGMNIKELDLKKILKKQEEMKDGSSK
jgi:DNA-directed RNA polymerase subunit alpha